MNSPDRHKKTLLQDYAEILPILPKSEESCTIKMPDGKEAKLPILKGTDGPKLIDVRSLYQQIGCYTFDPGFTSTGSCMSNISFIDGDAGKLLHRGYNIAELAEKSSYIELCYLLLYGILPNKDELRVFEQTV